ncbi:MAG TPA: thioredoxin family protein [Tepidisphaeraceae bacterium]|jgi:thiol-disulfide isomerase/thioredoxin
MLKAEFLAAKFEVALPYGRYVETGTDEQRRRWGQVYEAARLTEGQQGLVAGFAREMKVLLVSGIWCGDCVTQCPLLQRIAEGNPARVQVRILDRDQHRDLAEQVRINGGDRVPVAVFMAEDFEFCSLAGDRSLARYRALARKQLGAACPIAIGPPDRDETAATLQDWLDEFERVQLMLRLSARLRQKHGD